MAPTENEDKMKLLKEAIRCINGTIDFEKLAQKMQVVNAEAMRKRFKRAFEHDGEEPLEMTGSRLGSAETGEGTAKRAPRTPRASAKKRKVDEVQDANNDAGNEAPDDTNGQEDGSSPKKSRKPRTPKAPKSSATGTAKTTKTPEAIKEEDMVEAAKAGQHGKWTAVNEDKDEEVFDPTDFVKEQSAEV